ncbi:aminoacetone oxidase family FAD-binding enzyme [Acholeplasma equirhinis]|uniref:aminoacetone oxidase family FAD-binding enzyme n=1 Tax=Acholeplasma equirhinis TaxID=555393 RepID=UPI00197AE931|nr:aminoacetone oxidase family FAD-binding enzyme [Acholeplasma equirhinis]MBN3490134.1 aminoacetone oxidase family FAD-binding enzyme [Acholeplasma equirhinis]
MNPIVIIGGGPSGMMAAISAKMHHKNYEVILVERGKDLGTKMKLTGGGRCNVTARMPVDEVVEYIPKNGRFLYSTLNSFGPNDIIEFFEKLNCKLKEEDHARMFPVSNKAQDIVDTLKEKIKQLNVKVLLNSYVSDVNVERKEIIINDEYMKYQHLIIATGGITLPATGSDGTGHRLAEKYGHTITKLLPAEVPLVSNDQFIHDKTLQGLSFKDVSLSVWDGKKIKKTITHDLLITHFGLSGPAALRASFYALNLLEEKNEPVKLSIDFLPKVSLGELEQSKTLDDLFRDHNVPKRLVDFCKDTAGKEYLKMLKDFPMTTYATRGFGAAFVTNGGVMVKEVDPKTMQSKMNPYVSFCGEVLDINAFTGGFNITSAFSTGFTAGIHVNLD